MDEGSGFLNVLFHHFADPVGIGRMVRGRLEVEAGVIVSIMSNVKRRLSRSQCDYGLRLLLLFWFLVGRCQLVFRSFHFAFS